MSDPVVMPKLLSLQAPPAQSAEGSVTVTAPSDAQVTASITGGDSLLTIKSVTAVIYVWRDANPNEGKQLLQIPGSNAKAGNVSQILVPQVVGTSDGNTALSVPAGATVTVVVQLSPPANQTASIGMAALNVTGTTWPAVSVPITWIAGPADTPVQATPASIHVAASPGQTAYSGVMIDNAPVAAKVLFTLASPDTIIRANAVTYLPEKRQPTQQELAQMPINVRQQAQKNGIIQYRQLSTSGAGTAFDVPATARLVINVDFATPAVEPPAEDSNILIILGTTWQRVEVPLDVIIGAITAAVSPNAISAAEGGSASVQATLTSVAGPDTDVSFSLGQSGFGTIAPASIHLPRGATLTSTLTLSIAPTAPTGTYPTGLDVQAFGSAQLQTVPFTLTVSPAAFVLTVLPPSMSLLAFQGDRATRAVSVVSAGGYKKLTFAVNTLPPGVTLVAPSWENWGAAATNLTLEFVVDPTATPVDNALASVLWDAGDKANSGRLDFKFSILLRPDSRSFSGLVETPAGTPFGGNVNMTLNNDGTGTFSGKMHDSGVPDYDFSVRAVVRSASGRVAVVGQKSGSVKGSISGAIAGDDPDRTFTWNDPVSWNLPKFAWSDIRAGSMAVSKSYELSGVLGTLSDLLYNVLDFVISLGVVAAFPGGAAVVSLVFMGSELSKIYGIRVVGPGGLVGVASAAGACFLVGPEAIIPAFIGGALVGDAAFAHRPLRDSERALATLVFGGKLPLDNIYVTNAADPSTGAKFTVPNIDGDIIINMGQAGHDSDLSTYTFGPYPQPGEVFIHELTHAWQIAHSPYTWDFFWGAAQAKLAGQSAYNYGPPGPAWHDLGLEQQASIVNEWYAGTNTKMNPKIARTPRSTVTPPPGAEWGIDDPYYGYISNNILLGQW